MKDETYALVIFLLVIFIFSGSGENQKYQISSDGKYVLETKTGRIWKWGTDTSIVKAKNIEGNISITSEGYIPLPYLSKKKPSKDFDGEMRESGFEPFDKPGILQSIKDFFEDNSRANRNVPGFTRKSEDRPHLESFYKKEK